MVLKLIKHKAIAVVDVQERTVESSSSIKYLGVIVDHTLNFSEHVAHACGKTYKDHSALLTQHGRPSEQQKKTGSNNREINPFVCYTFLGYSNGKYKKHVRSLQALQSLSALKVISAFSTNSEDTALVVEGMMPIVIIAEEASQVVECRKDNLKVTSGKCCRLRLCLAKMATKAHGHKLNAVSERDKDNDL